MTPIALPPLPEPTWVMPERMANEWAIPGAFSAAQMIAYARDAVRADRAALAQPVQPAMQIGEEQECSTHPDAPHGFDRNGSHNNRRYTCDCEGWEPDSSNEPDGPTPIVLEAHKQLAAWTRASPVKPAETRVQFETWMVNTAKIIVGSTDPYPAGLERDYWRVWQAATAHQGDAHG